MTPVEIWSNTKPSVKNFKVFGCNAYIHIQKEDRDNKLAPKATPGIFLGYDSEKIGYRVYSLTQKKVVVSRDVQFSESSFF